MITTALWVALDKLKHLAVKVSLVVVNIKFLLVVKNNGGCNCKVPFGITHTVVGKLKALSVV